MEEMICSFFGHREIVLTDRLYESVVAEINKAVERGFRTFYFGGYGDLRKKIRALSIFGKTKKRMKYNWCILKE